MLWRNASIMKDCFPPTQFNSKLIQKSPPLGRGNNQKAAPQANFLCEIPGLCPASSPSRLTLIGALALIVSIPNKWGNPINFFLVFLSREVVLILNFIRSMCQFFLLIFELNLTHLLLEIKPFGVTSYDDISRGCSFF